MYDDGGYKDHGEYKCVETEKITVETRLCFLIAKLQDVQSLLTTIPNEKSSDMTYIKNALIQCDAYAGSIGSTLRKYRR